MLCNTGNENINTKTTINFFFFWTLVIYQDWRGLLCVPSVASALLLRLQWPPISPCSRKSSLYLQWHRGREMERKKERAHLDRKFSQFCQTENNIRVLHFPWPQTILEGDHWPLMTSAGTPQVQVQVYGPAEPHMTGALQRGITLKKKCLTCICMFVSSIV